jgi:hypothetical protein
MMGLRALKTSFGKKRLAMTGFGVFGQTLSSMINKIS